MNPKLRDGIRELIERAHCILLVTHVAPDCDAIGSLLGLGTILQAQGRDVTLACDHPVPETYDWMPGAAGVVHAAYGVYDLVICLDCSDPRRVGQVVGDRLSGVPLLNIDHHVTNSGFGDLKIIDTAACATAEIVYGLIKAMGIEIDQTMATSIYTGIVTDTGSFRFSNTNHAAFAICDEMVQKGVQPYNVAQHVYGTYSLGRIKLLNLALETIEISSNGNVSMMMLTRQMLDETGTHPEDADGLINYARRIEDVKLAAMIQEQENGHHGQGGPKEYHVSLRSDGSVDVAAIAAGFGGGGHPSAAGFGTTTTLSDLKDKLIQLSETI